MSIATDIERVIEAKEALKVSIKNRGVDVVDTESLDVYDEKIKACPFAIRGTITPTVSTGTVEITGLPATPTHFSIYCPELMENPISRAYVMWTRTNGGYASGFRTVSTADFTQVLSEKGGEYGEGYFSFTTAGTSKFRAGYTYEYYVTGGFSE